MCLKVTKFSNLIINLEESQHFFSTFLTLCPCSIFAQFEHTLWTNECIIGFVNNVMCLKVTKFSNLIINLEESQPFFSTFLTLCPHSILHSFSTPSGLLNAFIGFVNNVMCLKVTKFSNLIINWEESQPFFSTFLTLCPHSIFAQF